MNALKIIPFLILFLITQSIYSQSGWVKLGLTADLEFDGVWFVNENTGFLGAVWLDTSVIYKTTNSGSNWFAIYADGDGGYISLFFLNENTGFATNRGIIKTTNSGESWNTIYVGSSVLFSIVFTSLDTGYACGKYHTVLKTTNGGENWISQVNFNAHHQNMCFVNNNTGFIVSEDNYVLKTTNGGDNWLMKSINDTAYLYGVHFINANTGFCGGWHYSNFYIAKTIDGGDNWVEVVNWQFGRVYRILFINNLTGFAVGTAFLKTTNAGQTWYLQQSLALTELYSVYFVNSLTGYACGIDINNQGVLYKTTTGGEPIGIQPISTEIPSQFTLYQNYPNPFNPSTKIKFSIPTPLSPPFGKGGRTQSGGFVSLIIYDILGREVELLVNEQLSPGTYEAQWNAADFSSGVYFYQLKAGEFSQTKKMVLIK